MVWLVGQVTIFDIFDISVFLTLTLRMILVVGGVVGGSIGLLHGQSFGRREKLFFQNVTNTATSFQILLNNDKLGFFAFIFFSPLFFFLLSFYLFIFY